MPVSRRRRVVNTLGGAFFIGFAEIEGELPLKVANFGYPLRVIPIFLTRIVELLRDKRCGFGALFHNGSIHPTKFSFV